MSKDIEEKRSNRKARREHLLGSFADPYGMFAPPKGWYIVSVSEGRDERSDPWLFCSLSHLYQWSLSKLAEADEIRKQNRDREIATAREQTEAFAAQAVKDLKATYPELSIDLICAIDASLDANP